MDAWIGAAEEMEYAVNVFLQDRDATLPKPEEMIADSDVAICEDWFLSFALCRDNVMSFSETTPPWLRWALLEGVDFCRHYEHRPTIKGDKPRLSEVQSILLHVLTKVVLPRLKERSRSSSFAA